MRHNIIKIDWHVLPFSKLKKPQVSQVGHKDGFQITWNFVESFELSCFNEMQSKVAWDFTWAFTHPFLVKWNLAAFKSYLTA